MSTNKKPLKMERLSPIPMVDRNRSLSDSMCTPVRPAKPPSHRRQKDAYAIETTSSPEFAKTPATASSSSQQKQRRYRNISKGKAPKKPNSTPLSGLISRKTVSSPPKKADSSDPYSSPTLNDMPSLREGPVTSLSEEQPLIDDYSPQKPAHSPRHSKIVSASTVFPKNPVPSSSNPIPLAGIVNRKGSNLNRSLNDSILVLQEAEDPSDDEEVVSNTSLPNLLPNPHTEKVSIESFESPRKPRYLIPKERTSSACIFQNFRLNPTKNTIEDNLEASSVIVKSNCNSVEMCGNERKNRKRALDFNSSTFMVPVTSDDVGDGLRPSILSVIPVGPQFVDVSSRECDCKSPIVNLDPPEVPVLDAVSSRKEHVDSLSPTRNLMSPTDSERVCQSPILNLDPPKTPILDTVSSGKERLKECHSPILELKIFPSGHERDCQLPITNLGPPKSPVLNLTYPSSSKEAYFEPLKTDKFLENNLFEEKQRDECPSDSDSVIESTPRPTKNRNQSSGGLAVSSCVCSENASPPSTSTKKDSSSADFEIPKIVEILEETSDFKNNHKCDLNFVVVSHESDESDVEKGVENSCDMVFPTIDGRHSPHLDLNYTKRPIQSFESPLKAAKPFSEAVDIGAFGSPDSNASYGHQRNEAEEEEELGTNEVIEPSTTQEYVEESEHVRPIKRRKKGSLLERVRGVVAKVDASNALFDYEMKCGLRPTKGKLVSAPLAVLKKSGDTPSFFLVCKPLKYCRSSTHIEDISSFVAVHVKKLHPGVCEGSVILLHFPVNAMYFSNLRIPCILSGHQIVPYPTEQKIDITSVDTSCLESITSFNLVYSKPITSFRTFSSVEMRTLTEAALCQNLVEESNLYLTVLHVTKLYVGAILKKMSVLCCDDEFQYCWLDFSTERDVKRAAALETLKILSDGSQVQTKGFSVVDRVRLDRKSKNLVFYCSNNVVNGEIIFVVQPKEPDWVISSSDRPSEVKKVSSSIGDVLKKNVLGCRYLIEVHSVEKESQLIVKDSQGQSIQFVICGSSSITCDHPVPFFLDGVYFYDGKIFSDEHTRVVLKT